VYCVCVFSLNVCWKSQLELEFPTVALLTFGNGLFSRLGVLGTVAVE
jgi:hypothetical protein